MSPEYVERNFMARLWEWLQRLLDDLFARAAGVPLAQWIAGMIVALLLVGLVLLAVNRLRRAAHAKAPADVTEVLPTRIGAEELRRRALAALARADHPEAVVDAFRALAVRQVERRRLLDTPGATAHEVGDQLAGIFVEQAHDIRTAAALFDLALYSDRPVVAADAELVLALDTSLQRPPKARDMSAPVPR